MASIAAAILPLRWLMADLTDPNACSIQSQNTDSMGISHSINLPEISEEERESVLDYDCTLKKIAEYIREGKAKKICLMTGAGISVSAGIPDFRTPGTGLYDNLKKYDLPKPEAIFDIEFFREDPTPFYDLARDLLPSNYHPTPMHHFIRLLQDKGLLLRCYTQNIDTLERQAGVKSEYLIEAHANTNTHIHTFRRGKRVGPGG